jgi:hypothetical protein
MVSHGIEKEMREGYLEVVMRKVKVRELSLESFARYGSYANMINPKNA